MLAVVSFFCHRFGKREGCPTKRAPDAGESAQISSSFLRLSSFPVGRLRRPRPSAGNANRWAGACGKSFARFPELACLSNWRLNLQNQVSGFRQGFRFSKVGLFCDGVFLFFGKFLFRLCQVFKIGFVVSVKVLAGSRFYRAKSVF
jgi:hypothetical protein